MTNNILDEIDRYFVAYALVGAAEGLRNTEWWVPLLTAAFTKTVSRQWGKEGPLNASMDFAAIMAGWAVARWVVPPSGEKSLGLLNNG